MPADNVPDAPDRSPWLPHPEHRLGALLGLGLLALAAFGVAVDLRLPWLMIDPGEDIPKTFRHWDDLRDPDAVAYEQRLLVWPLVAYGAATLVGAGMVLRSYRPAGGGRWFEPAAAWATGYVGFVLALTGTRWLGFYFARLSETGPTIVHLHAAPYVNLGTGMILIGAATAWIATDLRRWQGRPRTALWSSVSAGVAALGLLTLPLIPFAETRFFGGFVFPVDEFTIAVAGHTNPDDGFGAPEALGWARLMLWGCLYASLVSALTIRLPTTAWPSMLQWLEEAVFLNVAFVAAGGFFIVRFYQTLPDLFPNTELAYNYVLPVGFGAVGALWFFYLWAAIRADPRP